MSFKIAQQKPTWRSHVSGECPNFCFAGILKLGSPPGEGHVNKMRQMGTSQPRQHAKKRRKFVDNRKK